MPTSRPMSPTRTVKNAFSAARALASLLPPVPDQHERAEAHDLPAEDELDHVLGEHHHQHAGGEQRDGGEEVGVAAVAAHVLERVDLHERRDERDEQQHHHRQAVDVLADAELDAAALPPRPLRMTGSTNGSASPPSLAAHAAAEAGRGASGPASPPRRRRSVRWIHWHGGAGGEHQRRDHARRCRPRLPFIGSRLPNRMMTTKATPGMSGISQAFSRNQPADVVRSARAPSALHLGQLVERDRAPVAVDQQHHRQADADLGGGDGDDVQGERPGRRRCRAAGRRRAG